MVLNKQSKGVAHVKQKHCLIQVFDRVYKKQREQVSDVTIMAGVWSKYVAPRLEWVMISVIQVDVDVTKVSLIDNRVSNKHIYHST